MIIVEGLDADGTSEPVALADDADSAGAVGTLYIIGDLGGGTLQLEASPVASGDVWADVDGGDFTVEAAYSLQINAKRLRVTLASSTAADVTVYYE